MLLSSGVSRQISGYFLEKKTIFLGFTPPLASQAHTDAVLSLTGAPCGQWIASAGEVTLWDASRLTVLQTLPGAAPVRFSPDGQYLVCGNRPRGLKIWRWMSAVNRAYESCADRG
ncbi:MAG: hypothetical protein VKN60_00690 [Cyanobacteriota bacterium]|nr:hypothetical protein [Cyanobacteriota bacterium]